MNDQVSVTVTRQDKYRFLVDFGPNIPKSIADKPSPLGDATGPSPVQLLAAAVANCLMASLVFAHGKFKEDPGHLTATATCEIGRNEKNRLRVTGIKVAMALGVPPESLAISIGFSHNSRTSTRFPRACAPDPPELVPT